METAAGISQAMDVEEEQDSEEIQEAKRRIQELENQVRVRKQALRELGKNMDDSLVRLSLSC